MFLLLSMSDEDLKNKYKALEDHILDLEIRYIGPHIGVLVAPNEKPEDYNLDVHSFCILAHAAFEEYLEDISLYSVDRIEREFKSHNRRFSFATLCLLHFDENSKKLNDEKDWPNIYNDYLAERISKRKSELSRYATKENHGIDIKYLRKLLLPVGIDVPTSIRETTALDTLKTIRGAYAHSYARNPNPISPEDAEKAVDDVLEMVGHLKDKALNMSYYLL